MVFAIRACTIKNSQRFIFMKSNLKLGILVGALAAAAVANASNYLYSYTTYAGDSASLYLSTSSLGGGLYLVTGLTGERDGVLVTGTEPGGPGNTYSADGLFIYNNVLYPGGDANGDAFDNSGLLYLTANGSEYNIFDNQPGTPSEIEYAAKAGSYTGDNYIASTSLTATPGPAAIAPFALGIVGLIRRKRASSRS